MIESFSWRQVMIVNHIERKENFSFNCLESFSMTSSLLLSLLAQIISFLLVLSSVSILLLLAKFHFHCVCSVLGHHDADFYPKKVFWQLQLCATCHTHWANSNDNDDDNNNTDDDDNDGTKLLRRVGLTSLSLSLSTSPCKFLFPWRFIALLRRRCSLNTFAMDSFQVSHQLIG